MGRRALAAFPEFRALSESVRDLLSKRFIGVVEVLVRGSPYLCTQKDFVVNAVGQPIESMTQREYRADFSKKKVRVR